jgi:hypothetical protein
MIKVKISSFLQDQNLSPLFSMEGVLLAEVGEPETLVKQKIDNNYYLIITEQEYKEKISKKSKKNNPLMFKFEEYDEEY